jgi:hypothetical protein
VPEGVEVAKPDLEFGLEREFHGGTSARASKSVSFRTPAASATDLRGVVASSKM